MVSCVTSFWIVVAPRGMGALAIQGEVPDGVVAAPRGGAMRSWPRQESGGACANRGGRGRFPWCGGGGSIGEDTGTGVVV